MVVQRTRAKIEQEMGGKDQAEVFVLQYYMFDCKCTKGHRPHGTERVQKAPFLHPSCCLPNREWPNQDIHLCLFQGQEDSTGKNDDASREGEQDCSG